ncbi:MAG: hypothetical protein ACTH8H_17865 [Serratia proteamaculans]|nr:hypothetical protein [Serratia proteamaculans]
MVALIPALLMVVGFSCVYLWFTPPDKWMTPTIPLSFRTNGSEALQALLFVRKEIVAAFGANQGDVFTHFTAILFKSVSAFWTSDFYRCAAEHLKGIKDRHIFHRVDVGNFILAFGTLNSPLLIVY